MKNINNYLKITILIGFISIIASCEDPVPNDYIQEKYVEGYLIVGEPIRGIMLRNTQAISEKYNPESGLIKDALVQLTFEGKTITLEYQDGETPGYFYPDLDDTVKAETLYELYISTPDGKIITSSTKTPKTFAWIDEPKSQIYYPQDTLALEKVDSLKISWTPVEGVNNFLVRTKNLDTLNYGKYLTPATDEPNRRCYNFLSKNADFDFMYKNVTNWGLIANTETAAVWFAFKWFGRQTIAMFNPDPNMLNWFMNVFFTHSTQTDPLLNSIKGGYGVFGSASIIEKEIFLYKNQP
jgi:hypothetical protein